MLISVILAAGEGTRMKSNLPKCAHKVCEKALVNHVIDSAVEAGVEKNIVVVGYKADVIEEIISNKDRVTIAVQPIGEDAPYGTGFAVQQAQGNFEDEDTVVVLCGDTPLIRPETIEELMTFHKDGEYDVTVLTSELDDPTGYGRIVKDSEGKVLAIVEQKDASEEQREIKEVNSGIYCFKGAILTDILSRLDNDNAQGEYYITDAVEIVNGQGGKVGGFITEDPGEIQGINSKVQLAAAERVMRERVNEKFMLEGAILINPDMTYICPDAKIGKDTVLYPGVAIEGPSVIGENCKLGNNVKIIHSEIGDGVAIQNSTIAYSKVGDYSKIGPYAYLRPDSNIGKNVKIGDFVEVKNSNIGDGSKASHHSYIGDADVGENVNVGCGVVFVNYDGESKARVEVGDNVFLGCNSNLVSPLKVNSNSYIAAGSTVTEEVKENSLVIARSRQVEKVDWVINKGKGKVKK